jgi:hypothetical protein
MGSLAAYLPPLRNIGGKLSYRAASIDELGYLMISDVSFMQALDDEALLGIGVEWDTWNLADKMLLRVQTNVSSVSTATRFTVPTAMPTMSPTVQTTAYVYIGLVI